VRGKTALSVWLGVGCKKRKNEAVCARSEGNEVRAVCEYDRGRDLEGDEGAGRARGVYAEALASRLSVLLAPVFSEPYKHLIGMTKANRGS